MNIQHFDDKASLFMHVERINLLALCFFSPQHIFGVFFAQHSVQAVSVVLGFFFPSIKYECLMVLYKSFLSFNQGGLSAALFFLR